MERTSQPIGSDLMGTVEAYVGQGAEDTRRGGEGQGLPTKELRSLRAAALLSHRRGGQAVIRECSAINSLGPPTA
jgi:hypothetical protein